MSTDFIAELDDDEPEIVEAELVETTKPGFQESQQDRLRGIEDEILKDATEKILGAGYFSKIDPEDTAPPQEWVDELGEKGAMERFRLAKYALMNQKEAPVGLKMAMNTHASIVKARASEKAGQRVFNMTLVQMPDTAVKYPRLEVGQKK